MFSKLGVVLLSALFAFCCSFSNSASAQVVDPCWYGCPKEGCPGCGGGGGPIKQSVEHRQQECKELQDIRIVDCARYLNPDKNNVEYHVCIGKNKVLYDTCMNKRKATAVPAKSRTAVDRQAAPGDIVIPASYENCISSCDMQYTACIKNGNTNEYCNNQHTNCLNRCLKHK